MKIDTKEHYNSLDCNPKYVPQIQNILHEMGFQISHMYQQESYFMGISFRLHFTKPVPAIVIEAALASQSIVFFLHLN
ncbi:hypothetical protein QNI19_37425 [Cytophagaceae bacterium DM2B3-1]|uniref:Uncharacterized protein n=2 Tax=Xanthocytophaga TaxID=3078918 RepID=A0AAE3UAU4_9BACT|nr:MULTISPECIES: hypothetical protein [Xanthocytophaga]MDJ1473644.1 hypothetical protein [Xanthocytophaga flavus]MDJ1485881.1 hypothetical protein [Xanthocytophaga flavus]MDJ1498674.1 hypothetical protein [Xanthocytophaga flavus]MDJ1500219.1 hypothetical protein [Xanthocytophaga agilis]